MGPAAAGTLALTLAAPSPRVIPLTSQPRCVGGGRNTYFPVWLEAVFIPVGAALMRVNPSPATAL